MVNTWARSTSAVNGGLYCLCSSIMILKQMRTFSSFSICNQITNSNYMMTHKIWFLKVLTSTSWNINDNNDLTYGLKCSLTGNRWMISWINFLNCWPVCSAINKGSPSVNILWKTLIACSKKDGYCGDAVMVWRMNK